MAKVHERRSYDVAPDEMWARIRDFHGLDSWHPAIEASEARGDDVRALTIVDGGGTVVETQTDSGPRSYSYRIDESPLPVADYASTIRVEEDGQGCAVDWTAEFEPAGASEADAVEVVQGIFRPGLDALEN